MLNSVYKILRFLIQIIKVPLNFLFSLMDFGTTYSFDLGSNKMIARLNINNLLDEEYINQSMTNIHASSGSETWNGIDQRNFVLFGFGTTWNFSLSYKF